MQKAEVKLQATFPSQMAIGFQTLNKFRYNWKIPLPISSNSLLPSINLVLFYIYTQVYQLVPLYKVPLLTLLEFFNVRLPSTFSV